MLRGRSGSEIAGGCLGRLPHPADTIRKVFAYSSWLLASGSKGSDGVLRLLPHPGRPRTVKPVGKETSGPGSCAIVFVVLLLVPVGLLIGFVSYLVLIVSCPEVEPLGKSPFTGAGGVLCGKTSNPVAWAVFIASCVALVAGWVAILWFVVGEPGTETDKGRGSSQRPRR